MRKCIALSISLVISSLYAAKFTLLKTRDEPCSYIAYICDTQGKQYVVKQIKNEEPHEQFLLVVDCLAAYIASSIGIPCNRVEIIPPSVPHVGKKFQHLPATLHSLAPGVALIDYEGLFGDLDIQQQFLPVGAKLGPVPIEHKGLSKTVISNMARHSQLPKLVAYDTFIGNADRRDGNLFYDEDTDTFCGIDMGLAYKQNLCKEALSQLQRLINTGHQFTKKELRALGQYTQMLNILIAQFPPSLLSKKLVEFAEQAGFNCNKPSIVVKHLVMFYEDMIKESYEDAIALVALLEKSVLC